MKAYWSPRQGGGGWVCCKNIWQPLLGEGHGVLPKPAEV